MKNRRAFTGIEIVMILAITGAIALFAGPPLVKSLGTLTSGGDKNQQKATHKVRQQYQTFYQNEKGQYLPAPTPYKLEVDDMNYISTAPKPTIWDTVKKYAILLGFLAIAFPSFGVWLFKRFWDMKNNFTQLVNGIEEAKKELAAEDIAKLQNNLSKKMDKSAKLAVLATKANLVKSGDIQTSAIVQPTG